MLACHYYKLDIPFCVCINPHFTYNVFTMIFSICLLVNSAFPFLLHLLVRSLSPEYENQLISLLMGSALIGMILSIACFCMNLGIIDMKKKKTPIWWMIVSALAFVSYFAYIVFCLIERAHIVGISF